MFHVTGTDCHLLSILSLETSGRAKPAQCWTSWPQPSRTLQQAHACVYTAPVFQQDMLLGYACARVPGWGRGLDSPHRLEVVQCSHVSTPSYTSLHSACAWIYSMGRLWEKLMQPFTKRLKIWDVIGSRVAGLFYRSIYMVFTWKKEQRWWLCPASPSLWHHCYPHASLPPFC